MQKNKENSAIPNELLTFAFREKQIRVVIVEDQHIWLVASDVAEALAYQDASKVLASLNSKNIRKNQSIFDAQGKQITTTLIDVMGCGVLVGGAEPAVAPAFHVWVYDALIKGSIHDLRARANQVAKPSAKQEIGFRNFVFEDSNEIRVFLDEKGEPWFVASDVCHCLKLNTSEALHGRKDRNYEDGIDKKCIDNVDIPHPQSPNKTLKALAVSESGFYQLVFKSKKREAMTFKNWVTKEVLPTIRKTGEYKMPTASEALPETGKEEFTASQIRFINEIVQELIEASEQKMSVVLQKIMDKLDHLQSLLPSELPKAYLGKISYVYLCINLDSLLSKVGKANEPPSRILELQEGGSRIKLLDTIKFPTEELAFYWENVFQRLFDTYHVKGEWYRLDDFCHNRFKNIAVELNMFYAKLVEGLEAKQ